MTLTLRIQDWNESDSCNEDIFLTLPSNTPTPVSSPLQRLLQPETHCGIALDPALSINFTLHPLHVTSHATLSLATYEVLFERTLSYLAAQQLLHACPVSCNQISSYLQACQVAQSLFASSTQHTPRKPTKKNLSLEAWTVDLLGTVSACINDFKTVSLYLSELTSAWTHLGRQCALAVSPQGLLITQPNTPLCDFPRFVMRLQRKKQHPSWTVVADGAPHDSPLRKLSDTAFNYESYPIYTAPLLTAITEEHSKACLQTPLQAHCRTHHPA